MTLGLPGTGLFWTEHIPPAAPVHAGHRANTLLLVLVIVALLACVPWLLSRTN